jgi:antitoxin component YwqK of YwqJK toxin-antitoxin module
MRTKLSLFILFLVSTLSFSQAPLSKKIYLDSLGNETTEENHQYYRIVKEYYSQKDNYTFLDYYKSGILKMEGNSKNREYLKSDGQFAYYFENGNKEKVMRYKDSKPISKEYNWYENGAIKSEIEHLEKPKKGALDFKINQFWDSKNIQTVVDGNGDYDDIGKNGETKGIVKNGFKDGIWTGHNKTPSLSYTENYENGKLISGISIDSSNVEYKYEIERKNPEPAKGIKHFYNYIGSNFKTSKEATINNITGQILLGFVVEKDGSINDIKVLKEIGWGLDEEAVRVVNGYGKWLPGKFKGINRRVSYTLPITIQSGSRSF